ncbi:MAG: hypothetical protein ACXACA_08730 [Candidatus Ranarchaeia archaeon]|jgi:hypothetical protein
MKSNTISPCITDTKAKTISALSSLFTLRVDLNQDSEIASNKNGAYGNAIQWYLTGKKHDSKEEADLGCGAELKTLVQGADSLYLFSPGFIGERTIKRKSRLKIDGDVISTKDGNHTSSMADFTKKMSKISSLVVSHVSAADLTFKLQGFSYLEDLNMDSVNQLIDDGELLYDEKEGRIFLKTPAKILEMYNTVENRLNNVADEDVTYVQMTGDLLHPIEHEYKGNDLVVITDVASDVLGKFQQQNIKHVRSLVVSLDTILFMVARGMIKVPYWQDISKNRWPLIFKQNYVKDSLKVRVRLKMEYR